MVCSEVTAVHNVSDSYDGRVTPIPIFSPKWAVVRPSDMGCRCGKFNLRNNLKVSAISENRRPSRRLVSQQDFGNLEKSAALVSAIASDGTPGLRPTALKWAQGASSVNGEIAHVVNSGAVPRQVEQVFLLLDKKRKRWASVCPTACVLRYYLPAWRSAELISAAKKN